MSTKEIDYRYSGDDDVQPPKPGREGVKDPAGRIYYSYIPSEDLREVVNLAIKLQRPLLLEGEPGCGKTRLAGALAYELSCAHLKASVDEERKLNKIWPYYIWNVKSVSRARDGLYRYDAVARLRDAQLVGSDPKQLKGLLGEEESKELGKRLKDKTKYREFGPLGNALQHKDQRPVLLIDEIDKADSDFCNDLLLELDELRFEVPETGEKIPKPSADDQPKTIWQKPIIIITSNREKPLPEPFLRRCLYFYVDFPVEARLREIVNRRFGGLKQGQDKVVTAALERFYELRDWLEQQPGSRAPGTSEFLEFLTVLLDKPVAEAREDIENLGERLPLLGTLLKSQETQKLVRKQLKEKADG